MITNVILPDLIRYNNRVVGTLGDVSLEEFAVLPSLMARLPRNPFVSAKTPIIFVPSDILRHLPMASDWESAMDAAASNAAIRASVNAQVGEIWKAAQSAKAKATLKLYALSSSGNFEKVLEMIRAGRPSPYDQEADPEGLIKWKTAGEEIAAKFPVVLKPSTVRTADEAITIVEAIIRQFHFFGGRERSVERILRRCRNA